jgi:hypothetical protein
MQRFVPNSLPRPFREHGVDVVRDTRYAVRLAVLLAGVSDRSPCPIASTMSRIIRYKTDQ